MTPSKATKKTTAPKKQADVLKTEVPTVDTEASTPPVETSQVTTEIPDVQSGISIKNGVADTALDGEQRLRNKTRRPPIKNITSTTEQPRGRVIKEGEPVKIEADELNLYYVTVRENTYQERFVFGSNRPSYFLLYRAGQKVPKSRLQNLG